MRIVGTGSYLPSHIVSNEELSHVVDTTDEWIVERTGIRQRRMSTGEGNVDFALSAAINAIDDAKILADDIDLIIVATATPDYITPSMACIIQDKLKIKKAIAFDMNAACAGFLYALNTANCYMTAGMSKTALIIGTELLSRITDYTDRSTCVLFGDASGAVIVKKREKPFFICDIGADGSKHNAIFCKGRPVNNLVVKNDNEIDYLHMNGHEVYKFVVREIPRLIVKTVNKAGLELGDVKYFLLHQANQRMNEMIAKRLKIDFERFPCNLERTGNTSAASVPVLLDELNRKGRLKHGDKLVLCAFGAGMTWGAVVLEWI